MGKNSPTNMGGTQKWLMVRWLMVGWLMVRWLMLMVDGWMVDGGRILDAGY